ncbi:MAG: type II toxin-antitoxin system RelE/ParE family toxin [Candidatus Omnitrophota bacterium]|nr:MAG: type II toxin-antitoxin system RelE/ParE family toxin [Candidatus Omnitrophota bacterium]
MVYTITFKSSADRDLERIPETDRKRIIKRIDLLSYNPRPPGVVKISGKENKWRIRVGKYRVIYEIHDDQLVIIVIKVDRRDDVYRK